MGKAVSFNNIIRIFFPIVIYIYMITYFIEARNIGGWADILVNPVFYVATFCFIIIIINEIRSTFRGDPENDQRRVVSADWPVIRKQIFFIIGLILYLLLMPTIGFIVSTILFLLVLLYILETRNVFVLLGIPVGMSLVIFYIFTVYLRVRLPSGTIWP